MVLGGFSMVLSCGFGLVRLGCWVFLSSELSAGVMPGSTGVLQGTLGL